MRTTRNRVASLATAAGLLLLAAWLLPPRLDAGRFRAAIVSLASARLGRPVTLGGAVRVRLLPQPELTADGVVLPDRGDGVSARVGRVRLRVAMLPLFAGRIVVRELELGGPELTLPWPLPQNIPFAPGSALAGGFSAKVEGGRLHLGGIEITGIAGGLGASPLGGAVDAQGSARVLGRPWHVSARLGAPGADGASTLDLAIDGAGPVQDTGATFHGRILGTGAVAGRAAGRGPDLGKLLPAPSMPWSAKGDLLAEGGTARIDALALTLGGSPAEGAVALHLAPARLDLSLALGQLDLDAWLPTLMGAPSLVLPTRLALTARAAALAGGMASDLHGTLMLADGTVGLSDATAGLPGGAVVALRGRFARDAAGLPQFDGSGTLLAPDLRATLRWLAPSAPGLFRALPAAPLRTATLAGAVSLARGRLAVTGLAGRLDDSPVSGGFSASLGARPGFGADLRFDHVALDDWLPGGMPELAATGQAFAAFDGDLHIAAGTGTWRGRKVSGLRADLHAGVGGLSLERFSGVLAGVRLALSGEVGPDGSVVGLAVSAAADDAAGLPALLPAAWRGVPDFWRGPATLALRGGGKPGALALQLRVDLGDLRLEAEPVIDLAGRSLSGVVTLRHPGAPRLLASLGYPGVECWMDDGSLAVLAHVHAGAGHVLLQDFDLTAAALRVDGSLDVDVSGAEPAVTGRVHAGNLPLPPVAPRDATPLKLGWLSGWHGSVRVAADTVLLGWVPTLDHAAAGVSVDAGRLSVADFRAGYSGGMLTGAASLQTGAGVPALALRAELSGAAIAGPVLHLPLDLTDGTADVHVDAKGSGYSPAALLGDLSGGVEATLRGVTLSGLDMGEVQGALMTHPARLAAALRSGLRAGSSGFTTGTLAGTVDHGRLTLSALELAGEAGELSGGGFVDLPDRTLDLRLSARPAVPAPPTLGLRLIGPFGAARRSIDLAAGLIWSPPARP